MTLNPQTATPLRTNEGIFQVLRTGALVSVSLAPLAPHDAGGAASCKSLEALCNGWATSPDIYAVVLRADAAPSPTSSMSPEGVSALTALAWRFECFPKPLVALIDTHLSGTNVTLTQPTTHRIGGAAYRFAVPAFAATGGLPLGGIAHTLARLPGFAGLYLAMTGLTIGPADALALGLLTHTIDSTSYPDIIAKLADAQPVDPLLDVYPPDPNKPSLASHRAAIARCFSASSPGAITAALAAETEADAAWARTTLSVLGTKNADELIATYRLVSEASQLDMRETLLLSHSIALQIQDAGATTFPPAGKLFSGKTSVFDLPRRSEFAFGRF